jgi:uncharacterized repeat protein (TIGR01451 family)
MTKQSIIFSVLSVITTLFVITRPVSADMCTTQYGGTEECKPSDLTINKQVINPITKDFVENLTTTDPTFAPGSEITYRLIIKNVSGETFNPVNVKDVLPSYLTFVAGSPGTFDYDTSINTVNFKLENFYAGETRTFDLRMKVADASRFPTGKSLFCVANVAEVRALNRFDSDSAQACLGNGVLPVAGFNDFAMILPFVGVGLGGVALLRKSK